ncbi:O-antigen ligase family protein [Paenibacillus sp. y28]
MTFWISLAIMLLFLFISPYQRGLFNGLGMTFEKPILTWLVFGSVLLLVLAINLFYQWKLESKNSFLSLFIWLMPLTFIISTFGAASSHMAWLMVVINVLYATMFACAAQFGKSILGVKLIEIGVVASGYVIVIFGFLNWFGDASLFGIMNWSEVPGQVSKVYSNAVWVDSNGPRLTSVFQYPNTYAGYLIALLISGAFLITRTRRLSIVAVNALLLVPILLSFMLTLSRGAYVIIPVVLLLVLPFLGLFRQLLMMIYLAVTGITMLIVLNKVSEPGITIAQSGYNAELASSGWLTLLAAALLSAALITVIHYFAGIKLEEAVSRKLRFKFAQLVLPAALVVFGAIGAYLVLTNSPVLKVLPENIHTRIANINFEQHSVLERGTFYVDALKAFKDYPVFGAGGGAWGAVYEKYQNNPYLSRQAHSFFIQHLLDVGLVGILVLLVLLIAVYYRYIRSYVAQSAKDRETHFVFYIVSVALLLHSAIDFDLSFVYIGAVLFLCLGALVAGTTAKPLTVQTKTQDQIMRFEKIYPAVLVIVSLICIFASLRQINGTSQFQQAQAGLQQQKPFNEIMASLDKALSASPGNPTYLLQKGALLLQAYEQTKSESYYTQAQEVVALAKKYEPFNRNVFEQEYSLALKKNDLIKAEQIAEEGLKLIPWEINLYDRLIALNYQLGEQARAAGNSEANKRYWDKAEDIYAQVLDRQSQLEKLPTGQAQGRAFNVSANMASALGQMRFIRGDYANAEEVLAVGVRDTSDENLNRTATRWLLAAQQKQNKLDQALFDQLIAKDPAEKQNVEAIVSGNF